MITYEENTGLIKTILNKEYRGYQSHWDDLFQEGSLGLLEAIKRFDISRGVKFSSYARFWILRNIKRYINDKIRLIKVPISTNEGRKERGLDIIPNPSFSSIHSEYFIEDEYFSIEGEQEYIFRGEELPLLYKCLSKREKQVLKLRYEDKLTLVEAREVLKLGTRQRVSQIEQGALKKMRKAVEAL